MNLTLTIDAALIYVINKLLQTPKSFNESEVDVGATHNIFIFLKALENWIEGKTHMRPCKIQCTFYCHRVDKIITPLFVYVGPPPLGSK